MGENHRLTIGFIAYGKSTFKYLPVFLSSLKDQEYKDFKIVVIDNSELEDNENAVFLRTNYPDISFSWAGGNIGFAKAYNRMLRIASAEGAEYFLAVNPDMYFEPGCVGRLIEAMDRDKELGSAGPKVLRWNNQPQRPGKEGKKLIDTCGIKLVKGLRFIDAGQGEEDAGQYNCARILGPSGCAAIYRVSALEKIKTSGKKNEHTGKPEYFDELMFMYKEDCDLAYRLMLAGYRSALVPDAIVYHDRTASAEGISDLEIALNRKNKSRLVREWSFLNQQIIFIKFWGKTNLMDKIQIIWYEVKAFIYIILFEQYLLGQIAKLYRLKKDIIKY